MKKQQPKIKAYIVLEFQIETTRVLKGYLNRQQAEEHAAGLEKTKTALDQSFGVIKVSLQGRRH